MTDQADIPDRHGGEAQFCDGNGLCLKGFAAAPAAEHAPAVGELRERIHDCALVHWRTSTSGCCCGRVRLGESWPLHLADELLAGPLAELVAARETVRRPLDRTHLRDLHAQWHDQAGNLIDEDECGWERCEFWPVAIFALTDGARWQL